MSTLVRHPRRLVLHGLAVAAAALVLLTTALADVASAHGSAISPPSRNYGCWKRWGNDFQNPQMATQDPMCWQAWQADPNAMWNWNSLYRDGVAGNHQAAIPDGQLCSAGQTGGTRYAALDVPGAWQAVSVNNNFSVTVHDQARHGADYYRVYVTKQGFNPLTQRLRWSDIELAGQTGVVAPGQGQTSNDPVLNGVSVTINASAPGRTGRHVVYTIWKASHADQTYYFCSDVIFPGGSPSTPTPTATRTPTPTVSPTRTPTATPTPPPGSGGCSATYSIVGEWSGGFQAEVRVTAGNSAIGGWTVGWTFPNGQQIGSAWGATLTATGSAVTARNVAYNGSLAAGASTTFGFLGSYTSANNAPTPTCTAA